MICGESQGASLQLFVVAANIMDSHEYAYKQG